MGAAPTLTAREIQVLEGMSHGRSNAEIGRELFLSEDTVEAHARRLFKKLGASDRAHAVALGFRWGLVRWVRAPSRGYDAPRLPHGGRGRQQRPPSARCSFRRGCRMLEVWSSSGTSRSSGRGGRQEMSSGAPAHNASVHNYGRGATDKTTPRHHRRMRDDETTVIGALVHRAVDGDEQATHDLLARMYIPWRCATAAPASPGFRATRGTSSRTWPRRSA